MKARVSEALALVLAEEPRVAETDVVDLVAGAATVQSMPVLLRGLALSTGTESRVSLHYWHIPHCGSARAPSVPNTALWGNIRFSRKCQGPAII